MRNVGARVLVAEDDRMQADLIRVYLERDGHRVQVVHDGQIAADSRPGEGTTITVNLPGCRFPGFPHDS
jgi:DNA-binding response OmpR family regulator